MPFSSVLKFLASSPFAQKSLAAGGERSFLIFRSLLKAAFTSFAVIENPPK
jgi:hypothetical protein